MRSTSSEPAGEWERFLNVKMVSYSEACTSCPFESFVLTRENDTWVTTGTLSERNEYFMHGGKLFHKQLGAGSTAYLQDGEFVWGHRYRSCVAAEHTGCCAIA